jgi:hypothetical protein
MALLAVLAFLPACWAADAAVHANSEFFVISSIDRSKHQLVLLHATEISQIVAYGDKTQYFDDRGKPIKLTDLRAGDTVFVNSHKLPDGTVVADKVSKGIMSVAELRRRYVPYLPANAGTFVTPGH